MRRQLVLLAASGLVLVACSDPDLDRLESWQDKLDGHTVTYTATWGGMSGPRGPWEITERDGRVLRVEFRGSGDPPAFDNETYLLSAALKDAIEDDPDELDVTETIGALDFNLDPDDSATDDEWGYHATDIIIED